VISRRARGQWAIVCCAILWSTSGLFIKLLDAHPLVIAGGRSLIAGLFMLAARYWGGRRRRWVLTPPFWGAGASYALTMICFVIANKLTASANAILLQYSAPVWAALFGWLIAGERPAKAQWTALVLVCGALFFFFKDGLVAGGTAGDCLALFSGIAFGLYSVFMRLQAEPADGALLSHGLTALAALPFAWLFPPAITAPAILAILFMGVLQIGAASLLFAYGIKRVPAVQAMLTAGVEPVLNPLWVLAVTGERPAWSALAGGVIIIGAVLFSGLAGMKGKEATT